MDKKLYYGSQWLPSTGYQQKYKFLYTTDERNFHFWVDYLLKATRHLYVQDMFTIKHGIYKDNYISVHTNAQ